MREGWRDTNLVAWNITKPPSNTTSTWSGAGSPCSRAAMPRTPIEIAAQQYIEHAIAPFGTKEPGVVDGPTHLREAAAWLTAQFPDIEMAVESMVAEDGVVALRVASRGTNLGPINGVIPPTGRTFSSRQSHWFRVRDGRLAEHWATRDDLVTMLQLGLVPGPGRPDGGEAPGPRPGATAGAPAGAPGPGLHPSAGAAAPEVADGRERSA